ncbi:MAG: FAD:protein FMN transferase [Lachnospiraceae bacterium]|nr:FAD:protein FMN transferase [Lachnospiraceae bacterium]
MQKSILLFVLILALILSGCKKAAPQFFFGDRDSGRGELQSVTKDGLLGTAITISTYDDISDDLFSQCFETISALEARMSVNMSIDRAESEISLLNDNAGSAFSVADDIYDLLKLSVYFSEITAGAFDISIGPVMELWKEDGHFAILPSRADINQKLNYVGYEQISFPDKKMVYLGENMKIDLGAIAKGQALSLVRDILLGNGVRNALLDFGGDIYAAGQKPDGSNWRIAIKTPLAGDNSLVCLVEVADLCVMTSGGYERYFEQGGIKYHHILDPATGYPADSGLLSVTVVSPDPVWADALSTAGFVMGMEKGLKMINGLAGYEAIFITTEKEIYVTDGLREVITILHPDYSLR